MDVRFSKYEGLGNDFVVVDGDDLPASRFTPELARRWCDRHRGIGGDGVLWVDRASLKSEGRVRMVILNADGSRPEMCGNGVRCVVAWVADQGGLRVGEMLTVESDAGPRPAVLRAHDGERALVQVAMGRAVLGEPRTVAVGGVSLDVDVVDMGNPHGVVFGAPDDPDAVGALVRGVIALPVFPKGVNVELVTATRDGFRTRVHERGVGWTQACGTGACAVAAAAVVRGRAAAGEAVTVTLDGGPLTLVVSPDTLDVEMTGTAARVFSGVVRD